MGEPEFYDANLDGTKVLRVAGRFRRRGLPLAPVPPPDVEPERCFLCHPQKDPQFLSLRRGHSATFALLAHRFPVLQNSWLLAPCGVEHHHSSAHLLSAEVLEEMLRLSFDPSWHGTSNGERRPQVAFLNVGQPAGQTRLHPHMQLAAAQLEGQAVVEEVARELEEAARHHDALALKGGAVLVLPSRPALTAEAWLPFRLGSPAYSSSQQRAALGHLLRALERGISANFNLVALPQLQILRVLPRGISERAGLEFAFPSSIQSVVACSAAEARALWAAALEEAENDP